MKRTVSAIVIMLMLILSAVPAFADFANPSVIDGAGYLSESQLEELSAALNRLRENYSFDVAIYTEAEMSGEDAQSCADDIFDYSGYGFGENADGMILYISANPRQYHFSTHGSGEEIFNDNGLYYLEENILPSLQDDDYYTALKRYAELSEELLEMAAQGEPFDEIPTTMGYACCVIGVALLLPLLIAYIKMKAKLRKMKTAVENNYAANYMKPGSMNLSVSRDIFLYSTMTQTAKPKAESGGHISSSGEHHGGRGGSF